jgi:hypothetical protein
MTFNLHQSRLCNTSSRQPTESPHPFINFPLAHNYHRTKLLNVVVDRLTLLLRIREVPGSNLGPETGYPESGRSWFSSIPPDECRGNSKNYATTASFEILPIHYSRTYHPFIRRSIVLVAEKASLNELQIYMYCLFVCECS